MPEFKIIDLPNIRIRAAVEGSGSLVVMVHGFPEIVVFVAAPDWASGASRVHGLRH